jgi:hypothetical protein
VKIGTFLVALESGAQATLDTVGGTGPVSTAAAGWEPFIDSTGGASLQAGVQMILRLLLFIVMLLSTSVSPAHAGSCPDANPNDNTPDDDALQSCLDSGGVVTLDAGSPGYIIAGGLLFSVANTVLTSTDTNDRATLIAHADLNTQILRTSGVSGLQLLAIKLDGNKVNRTATCSGYRGNGTNISLFDGDGWKLINIESSRALCGTALEISGTNYEIANSQFYSNGYSTGQRGGEPEPWADGITLVYCQGGHVHDNYLEDSTDIAIVSGGTGGYGCRVENNVIHQANNHAFAGIAVHNFVEGGTGGGDHMNSLYQNNTITSALNQLDLGISVGMHGWFPDRDTFGGSIINNSVSGARISLDIYGYHDGTVNNNAISNPQGSFFGFGANYAAANVSNTCLQLGWVVKAVSIVNSSTSDTEETITSTCGGSPPSPPSSSSSPCMPGTRLMMRAAWPVMTWSGTVGPIRSNRPPSLNGIPTCM